MAKDKEEIRPKSKPFIDIKEQAALGAEVPPARDVAREVFGMMSETANVLREKGQKRGALIVIGDFASIGSVKGAIPPRVNPFEGLFLSAGDKAFQKMLLQSPALEDGAVVVDKSGQVLGGRIYLLVDNPLVDVPEGCFARHRAAASASLRKDVEAVITLSEEKNVARVFRNGKVVEEYDPAVAEAAAAEKAARAKKRKRKKAKKKKGGTTRRAKRKSHADRRAGSGDPPPREGGEAPKGTEKAAEGADASGAAGSGGEGE
ncbi:MAG: diadenylate cyclase [Planctomycetota bacterium]